MLFKTDLGIKKTFNSFNINFYLSDIFNTYGKSKIIYRGNQIQISNQLIQKNYTRSISLSLSYNFGNNKLNTIKLILYNSKNKINMIHNLCVVK